MTKKKSKFIVHAYMYSLAKLIFRCKSYENQNPNISNNHILSNLTNVGQSLVQSDDTRLVNHSNPIPDLDKISDEELVGFENDNEVIEALEEINSSLLRIQDVSKDKYYDSRTRVNDDNPKTSSAVFLGIVHENNNKNHDHDQDNYGEHYLEFKRKREDEIGRAVDDDSDQLQAFSQQSNYKRARGRPKNNPEREIGKQIDDADELFNAQQGRSGKKQGRSRK